MRPVQSVDEKRIAAERAFAEGRRLRLQTSKASLDLAIEKFQLALSSWRELNDRESEVWVIKMSSPHRIRRLRTRKGDSFTYDWSDGRTRSCGSHLLSRILRSAAPPRSGGRRSSPAAHRVQTQTASASITTPGPTVLDYAPPFVARLGQCPIHRQGEHRGVLASPRLQAVLAIALLPTARPA